MSTNQKNYRITNVGEFGSFSEKGRVMLKDELGMTGCEISINSVPAGKFTPFVHAHKLNEEIYIIVRGHGLFMVDGEEFDIQEGTIIRVSPKGERAIKAKEEELVYICIQVQVDSLTQASKEDGIIIENSKASWM